MQVLIRYFQKLPRQTRVVLQTCLYGLGAGAATVAFQLCMNWLYRLGLESFSHKSLPAFLAVSFIVMVGSSLLAGWLLNAYCREASGSGIPQLKLAFWKDYGTVPFLEPAVTCLRSQTIQDLQRLLLDSTTQFIVVLDKKGGDIVGVVTLHDLLRSHTSATEHAAESCDAEGVR